VQTPASAGGGIPAYVRIAASLRERVRSMPAHSLVPSERELSEIYDVSRMTARRAVGLLESEGYVYRRPPQGTFVAEPRLILRLGSFAEEVARLGHQPKATVLHASSAHPEDAVRQALGLAAEEDVYSVERLRTADGVPLAIENTFLPVRLAPDLLRHDLSSPLWALLRREYGVRPHRAVARVECLPLDGVVSGHLGVRQASPGIVLTRHTYDMEGACVEFARDIYRADRTAFLVSEELA
jgi:GntR family transcriptional regulator